LELGKRLQLSAEEIVMLSADEIVSLLLTNVGISRDALEAFVRYAITVMVGRFRPVLANQPFSFNRKHGGFWHADVKKRTSFKVSVLLRACRLVRVVTEYADVALLEPGDTCCVYDAPEYTQLECGRIYYRRRRITCHAAII
jgi:hypothetical protein